MPRPGPRPYECIRRAWHSDSHQPLRGALIQEIFRVVNEIHSTSTRRKKEWQEKLPIVVLRAEEILYSKANSEAEYASVETLRARLDDAVNTLIRREDGEEEGVYLAPCVEAALSLGCTPKKIPRGQRQGASRLFPNTSNHNHVSSSNMGTSMALVSKGGEEMKNMDYVQFPMPMHDRSTSSTISNLGAHNPLMQEQGIHSLAPPMSALFGQAGLPPRPILCRTSNPSPMLPQALVFPNPYGGQHTVMPPSLPQPGGMVQYLRSTETGRHLGVGNTQPVLGASQMQVHGNREPRTAQLVDSMSSSASRVDAQILCRDTNGSLSTTSLLNSLEVVKDRFIEARSGYGGAMATTRGLVTCTSPKSKILLPRTAQDPRVPMPLPSLSQTRDDPSPSQRSCLTAFPMSDSTSLSHPCVYDLQLRLAPPGKEVTAISDTSASKRMRIDLEKLDKSASSSDLCQLYARPLSQ